MLTDLLVITMMKSKCIAASASSGIGKSTTVDDFAAGRAANVLVWRPIKKDDKVRLQLVRRDLVTKDGDLRKFNHRFIRGLFALARERHGETERQLIVIDDVQKLAPKTLRAVLKQIALLKQRNTIELADTVGAVLLGNEQLLLPSNWWITPSRSGEARLAALRETEAKIKANVILGPTLTTRAFTRADVVTIARSFGATEVEAANLGHLHQAGRIDPTFPEVKRLLRAARRTSGKNSNLRHPLGAGVDGAWLC